MSDETLWQQLESDWKAAKAAQESAQEEVDALMRLYLAGKGNPPSRKMMTIVDDLCFHTHEARGALDQLIAEHAS